MRVYHVFVRYNTEGNSAGNSYSCYYEYYADIEIDEYVGSYDSRAAASAAAREVDIAAYNASKKGWKASFVDAWTTFAFLFESDMNAPVKSEAVSDAADKIAAAARKEWLRSPAGLAHAEAQKRLSDAYKARSAGEKERRAAEKRERQDHINAKARATRAANKAAAQAALAGV